MRRLPHDFCDHVGVRRRVRRRSRAKNGAACFGRWAALAAIPQNRRDMLVIGDAPGESVWRTRVIRQPSAGTTLSLDDPTRQNGIQCPRAGTNALGADSSLQRLNCVPSAPRKTQLSFFVEHYGPPEFVSTPKGLTDGLIEVFVHRKTSRRARERQRQPRRPRPRWLELTPRNTTPRSRLLAPKVSPDRANDFCTTGQRVSRKTMAYASDLPKSLRVRRTNRTSRMATAGAASPMASRCDRGAKFSSANAGMDANISAAKYSCRRRRKHGTHLVK